VNAAGDGCDPICDSGVVNAAKDGCDPLCSTGTVNATKDGCEDAGATFSAPGEFKDAGTFTPEQVGTDGGAGVGVIVGGVVGGLACCLLLLAAVLLARKRQEGSGGRRKRTTLSEQGLPPGWSSFIDKSSGYPCYVNDETGEIFFFLS
jgi:hypothetical protein